MLKRFFTTGLIFVSFILKGQFNDSTNYYIKYSATGVVNKTNDRDAFVLNNNLKLSLYKKNISVNTNAAWIYGEQQRIISNNDFSATLDFDLYKTRKHIYYWGLVNYEKSLSLKINNRLQAGLGIGYYLIDREHAVLQISDGLLYETSDLYSQEGLAETKYETYRNSFRIKFRIIFKDVIALDGVDFLQHSLSESRDYIIRSHTNLSIKLYKWISLAVSVAYNKLNATRRENFLLNYGVTLEKYF
jgi:hypothetical protein